MNNISALLNIRVPIIQAPMAGITSPELVAAVSNAGALGSLAAGYLFPEEMRSEIRKIRALTPHPFAVNLFIPSKHKVDLIKNEKMMAIFEKICPYWHDIEDKTPSLHLMSK